MNGRTGQFYDNIRDALKEAGWEMHRNNNGHDLFRRGEKTIPIPRKLDSVNLYKKLLKLVMADG